MQRTVAIGVAAIGIGAGAVIAIGAVLVDEDSPTDAASATTTTVAALPPPFAFDAADEVIEHACREVRDVNKRAITAAGEAYDRGTFVSIPARAEMIADAEVIRLRRAALAAEVAQLEVSTLWQVAEPITVLALAATVYPDDPIVDELLFAEGVDGGTIGLEQALDRALEACEGR